MSPTDPKSSSGTSSHRSDSNASGEPGPPTHAGGHGGHGAILAGLGIGAVAGLVCHGLAAQGVIPEAYVTFAAQQIADPIGKLFLRLMFMVVLPLVFSALALSVIEMGDLGRLGRVGLRSLLFAGLFSGCAVFIGMGLVNFLKPGQSLSPEKRELLLKKYEKETEGKVANAKKAKPLRDTIVDLLPENPLQEMVGALDGSSKGNGMLAVMCFALIVGAAATTVPDKIGTFVAWLEGWQAIAMVVIRFAMRMAPLGAGALVFSLTATLGWEILVTLGLFVLTTLLGLGLQLVVVYSIAIALFSRMRPWEFFKGVSEAILVAFSSSSSNATLPTALKVADEELKLNPQVSRFVLTVGATGNQNGTALYEGVVVLFLAQVFAKDLTLADQFRVVLMSILAGVGTAGVPGGSIPLIIVLLESVGVPGAGIGLILGVDRILDMSRTVLNVTGDLAIATCVAHQEEAGTRTAESPRLNTGER